MTKYDSKGRESENLSIDPDGGIDSRVVREYDGRGDATREITHESDVKVSSVTIRHYDRAHHILFEEDRSITPEPTSKRIFRYNDKAQLLEEIFNSENGSASLVYEYDESGRPRSVETVTASIPAATENAYGRCGDCGVFPGKTTYRYNDDGLLTEERIIQPGNKLIGLSEYEYDAHGHHVREWGYSTNPSS